LQHAKQDALKKTAGLSTGCFASGGGGNPSSAELVTARALNRSAPGGFFPPDIRP
jgi:hypothetical protein